MAANSGNVRKKMSRRIQIKLFASLNRFTADSHGNYPIAPGMIVKNLLTQIGIPVEEVNLIIINGKQGNLASALKTGDRLGIFPPIGGG